MKLPSGPKTPAFLQMARWISDPVSYMEKARKSYGDIFTAKVGASLGDLVFVSDPQALQQILTNDRKQFTAPGGTNRILSSLIGDYSVILLDGEQHKKRRQLLLPPFHGERMRSYGEIICRLAEGVVAEIPLNKPFIARSAMQSISLQVIMEAVFGISEGERYQRLKTLLTSLLDIFRFPVMAAVLIFPILQKDLGRWSPWGQFIRTRNRIDDILYAEIAERRENPDPNRTDTLSLLMSAKDEAGNGMTDVELRDELMTLLFAGHETTATAMAWLLYWTHHLPEVREKILQELASLGDNPNPVEIARLPYLTAVCYETLRIYPVGMLTLPRVVQEPVELGGNQIEPGTLLMGCIYLAHHREETYPDHHHFKPERFLEKQFSQYEFIPFGGGARRCIGEALALFEMKLALATILSRYELTLVDRNPEKPHRRGLTLAPAKGVRMVVKGRRITQKSSPELVSVSRSAVE